LQHFQNCYLIDDGIDQKLFIRYNVTKRQKDIKAFVISQ
jgi:hypothetical protein